jgi:hypothetical protein
VDSFYAQAQAQWLAAGGPPWAAPTAAAIAAAESASGTQLVGDQGTSFGWWQIHTPTWTQFDPAQLQADPAYNAAAAVHIFNAAGGKFTDWSTFNSGAYLAHLPDAAASGVASLPALAGSGGTGAVTAPTVASGGPVFAPAALPPGASTMLLVGITLVLMLALYGMTRAGKAVAA